MRKAFFLTSGRPVPVVGARRIRDAQIITLLAKRLPVEVLCVSEQTDTPSVQTSVEAQFGERVTVSCHPLDGWNPISMGLNLVRPHFAKGYSKSIESTLRSKAKPGDIVWLSRLRMGKYIGLARKLGCFSVLDEHQIESDLLFDNAFARLRNWHHGLNAAQCALYEKRMSYAADLVVTTSPIDASRMEKLAPHSKAQVLPYALNTASYVSSTSPEPETQPQPREVILSFIGDLSYIPNLHALDWLRTELLPRISSAIRGVKLSVRIHTQSKDLSDATRRFSEFTFHGYNTNEELLFHLRHSTAAIFPLRYGRGNRIHILEALAAGIPVVTTGRGVDGLILKPLEDFCLAEKPDDFASHIMRLVRDPLFRASLISHGKRTVQTRFDWAQSGPAMADVFTKLGL